MAGVLTKESNVTCGHSGTVSVQGADKLTVNGKKVLRKTDISGQSVGSCTTVAKSDSSGPTDKPCATVSSVDAGEATKLTVGGSKVMLDTLAGQTDGMVGKVTPQLLLAAAAVQSKLTAV
jgi:hypothetical protein